MKEKTTPAIEIVDLDFAYGGGRPVLEGVSLEVEALDFASVVGPNGGGKTTLLKLMLGLLRPTRGEIRVLGTTPVQARQRIGYMPQHAQTDPRFPVSVIDVVLMGRLNVSVPFGPYTRRDREAARRAIHEVELDGLRNRAFSSLSGGERQRVLLARAIAADPDLLLLDEPAAGMDQRVEVELHELLCRLNKRVTILLVSHDLGFVSRYVKTVICVSRSVVVHPTSAIDGRVIAEVYGTEMRMVRHDHSACGECGV